MGLALGTFDGAVLSLGTEVGDDDEDGSVDTVGFKLGCDDKEGC